MEALSTQHAGKDEFGVNDWGLTADDVPASDRYHAASVTSSCVCVCVCARARVVVVVIVVW